MLRKQFISTMRLRGGSDSSHTRPDLLPEHPSLTKGELENGLRYVILQNSVPKSRFHANLMVGYAIHLPHQSHQQGETCTIFHSSKERNEKTVCKENANIWQEDLMKN